MKNDKGREYSMYVYVYREKQTWVNLNEGDDFEIS
jgi:hypothetical protein